MKRTLRLLAAGISLALLLIWQAPVANADVNDFTVRDFSASYRLTKEDPQGTLQVSERIKLTFTDRNHGILRAIPTKYKDHKLQLHVDQVSSPTGAPAQYSTYTSNDNLVLRIGDPEKTVTGDQEYVVSYTVRNVIGFYKDHDELFWDINGDQWQQPFNWVNATIGLPADVQRAGPDPVCYTGGFGSTDSNCSITYNQSLHAVTARTTRTLGAGQTMSVVVGFEKGYFQPSKWHETLGEYAGVISWFLLPFLLIAGGGFGWWWRRGRDAKGRRVIVPEYAPPDKLKALEVGTLMDFRTDNKDLTATIIDLAVRGYIKIIQQTKERVLRRDVTIYTFRLQKADWNGLQNFEHKLLSAIFEKKTEGEEVDMSVLKFKLAKTATEIRQDTSKSLTERGYFKGSPHLYNGSMGAFLFFGIWIVIFAMSFFHLPTPAAIGVIGGALVAALFVYLLPARTANGVFAKESALGLKLYLQTAEADRITMLQSPNAPYAAKSQAPARTVELFEKLLPYAMVLGVEKEWAKQFDDLYRGEPDWYSGTGSANFSAVYLATALNAGVGGAVNSAFSSPSSSSGSGFSGGGSSGGGGGGGGGGGW
jgi:uncharacterized membrane protein YgcG